ncbi:hypothetical protein BDP81DRAFT_209907 [Colletotrichum phormii]|uniref:Uncharacterized protein n=1 Tax=Colletotrichum phormii TaxID=359342 RepID=A0AAJ0EEU9_9PEZI|nr:uncharacterized protein BDP81DRAFT_209907 [Colletotrichum phormii]KAK1637462.1 hypothetical protein BDP81DRAFT_209907 [Colletotrichum phormii]
MERKEIPVIPVTFRRSGVQVSVYKLRWTRYLRASCCLVPYTSSNSGGGRMCAALCAVWCAVCLSVSVPRFRFCWGQTGERKRGSSVACGLRGFAGHGARGERAGPGTGGTKCVAGEGRQWGTGGVKA